MGNPAPGEVKSIGRDGSLLADGKMGGFQVAIRPRQREPPEWKEFATGVREEEFRIEELSLIWAALLDPPDQFNATGVRIGREPEI